MSAVMEVVDITPAAPAAPASLPVVMTPGQLVSQLVQQGGALDLSSMERLMALQERWDANEAKKAFNRSFSAFKAEALVIVKRTTVAAGPLSGKTYAELHSVIKTVTPALSRHGLSAAWAITKDEPQWIEVTCTLKHIDGHSESVSMGGPPDAGGAKNQIQARASTVSYLERYTLKAITGLSEGGDDDDGNGAGQPTVTNETRLELWSLRARASTTLADLKTIQREANSDFAGAKDLDGWNSFKAVYADCKATMQGGAA